jgi:glycosyltransferase involved in cell wall biosynthesis
MERVAVLIPTYDRFDILRQCISALEQNLKGVLKTYYVGNDHDKNLPPYSQSVKIFNEPTGSLGANLNRLIKAAISDGFDYLFQLDDDHILLDPLDLTPHIEELKNPETNTHWIRLMGVGSHNYDAHLNHKYWMVNWKSPELYITSNRPHLKTTRFHKVNGFYPEGKTLGQTEEGFCHQCKDINGRLQVAIPLTYDDNLWDHVGHSWQMEGF